MKIRNKILIYSLAVAVISLLIVMADSFYNIDSNIIKNIKSKLESTASIQKNRIKSELENHKIQAGLVANRTSLTDDVVNFNKTGDQQYADSLKTRAIDVKTSSKDFKAVYILDQSGKTIAGTDNTKIEKLIDKNFLSKTKQDKQVFIYNTSTPIKDLILTAPIFKDKIFQGIVLIETESDTLQTIMADYSGLGDTGETTIAFKNQQGNAEYIRPPRFADTNSNLIIPKENTNVAIIQALSGVESVTKNNIDYRGHSIYAATKYIESTGWGLVVKIDKAELYKPIFSHAIQLGAIGLVLILLVIIFSFRIANTISKPIEQLKEGAEEITKGDLNRNIVINSKDEIGVLSKSFDQMMKAVITSRAEVDQKVEAQTKEINAKAHDMQDQQKAIINILEDVEEEKEITKREKDKIDTILKSIGDAVFVVDRDLKIILVNKITTDLCGYKESELIGQKYSDVLKFVFEEADNRNEKVNDKFVNDAIRTGEIQEMSNHTVLITKLNKRIPVADSAAPLKNQKDEIIGCVVVFRDVTHEHEIDKAKTEFVSLASHQLRTPLSAINWYSEMLLDGDAGKLNDEQKSYIEQIAKGNKRMVELVNSLLNVSRIELGTFAIDPSPTDFKEIAESILGELKPQIATKKQEITTNYENNLPKINADPKLIRIIIQNYLTNAIKYTPEKGKINLSITTQKAEGKIKEDSIIIAVKDNGYGIPAKQQNKIFQKLFRADNIMTKDTEGTGLGLYIVKSIAEQSDGLAWFDSEENKGTTFFASIPLRGMVKKEGTKELS